MENIEKCGTVFRAHLLEGIEMLRRKTPAQIIDVLSVNSDVDFKLELNGDGWLLIANGECACKGSLKECSGVALQLHLRAGWNRE